MASCCMYAHMHVSLHIVSMPRPWLGHVGACLVSAYCVCECAQWNATKQRGIWPCTSRSAGLLRALPLHCLLHACTCTTCSPCMHMHDMQSAYRSHHSTETVLLKVLSDVLTAIGDKKVTLLALLDLSAAFDCMDHDILLSRLQSSPGLA